MATKDQIDVEKVRKEATKKVEFLLTELNKNLPGITEGSAAGAGAANSKLLAAMSEREAEIAAKYISPEKPFLNSSD